MDIVINTRFLIKGKLEGIGRFTLETIKRICKNHPEHTFHLLFDRLYDKEFVFSENVKPIIVPYQARHPLLWRFWFHRQVPRVLNELKPAAFVSTDGYTPLETETPIVNVIHDLNFEHNPHHLPKGVRKYYLKYFPQYAKIATRIATVSEYSKQDIHNVYGIPKDNIDVVYNGVSSEFEPLIDEQKSIIKTNFANSKDYFVYVGSLHPRKNIEGLFEAYAKFKYATESDMALVVVGEAMFMSKTIKAAYENHPYKDDIIFTGRVGNKELGQILGSAYAMTYVPLFEGFGIPILEAFACDVPVITSNCTSMPEVAGDAAILCDPENTDEISNAMSRLVQDNDLRLNLIEKAKIQRDKFSWDKSAELLWSSIEKAINKKKN
jgi:glycosyltransferase involved in cell wall biosynthesis